MWGVCNADLYSEDDREIEVMEPVRVLNLFTIMNRGGAETMVMNYYRKINREKVQFDFLVHREEEGAYEQEIKELGGRIYRMPPMYPQNFSLYKKKIREFFEEHKEYKIIHSHMSELGYFALREAARQEIPVRICHAHNAPHGFEWKMIVRNYFKKRMMPYLTHMFMCGKESGDWLFGKENEDKFIQLNNAINAERFRYDRNIENNIRKKLNLEDKLIIGHVGRFTREKNHKFMLDILKEIKKIKSNSVLIFVGNGELEDEIKNKARKMGIANEIRFLGVRSDVKYLMQAMDIFLFPSFYEGLGIVLIEAQALGLESVVSENIPDEAFITDLVHKVSLEKDASYWAKKIIDIYNNKKNRKGRQEDIVKAGYDIVNTTKFLEEFYLESEEKARFYRR